MKVKRSEVTAKVARELLDYDPATGECRWRERDLKWFASTHRQRQWNSKWAGKEAFTTVNPCGYRCGSILEVRVVAHRVAWLLHYGEWPKGDIDHINGTKTDNRIANLRDVTHEENLHNSPRRSTNKSGVTGVFWTERSKKWRAYICLNSRLTHIGYFTDFEEAVAARKAAELRHGYHVNHGREPDASAA
jgi:hypothetical protein